MKKIQKIEETKVHEINVENEKRPGYCILNLLINEIMKIFFKFSWIILPLIFFCTCTCTMSDNIDFDAPSRELKSVVLMDKDSTLIIGNTNFITMINNYIYIRDLYDGLYYTKYDTKNHETHRFCKRGNGPGEMVMPSATISSLFINDIAYIGLFDVNIHKILFLKEDSLMVKHKFIEISFGFSSIDNFTSDVFILNDSVILVRGGFNGYVCKMYKHGEEKGTYMKVFTKQGNNDDFEKVSADGNQFAVSPDKAHVVRITQFGGLIEAYKIENMELTQLFSKQYFDVICNPDLSFNNDTRYGYIDVAVSDSKIYGLYDGDIVRREDPFKSKVIHVYDMTGKLIEKLLLDKYITTITVNNENTELYALSKDEKDLLLFKLE
jgi:hypothetical protein